MIPKRAPNVDAAYAWMNLTADPDIATDMMQRLFFATPSQTAYDRLPEDFRNDPTLFPAPEILAKCEGIIPLAPDIAQLYDRYWTQLTSS